MSNFLKGYLGREVSQGWPTPIVLRRLYFTCPIHGANCLVHYHSIPVTLGEACKIQLFEEAKPDEVWHYEARDGVIYISPSIDLIKNTSPDYPCRFHNYYNFQQVFSKEELK